MLMALALRLWSRRWKVTGLLVILKTRCLVRPIAEGLAGGVTATAKCHCGPPAKAVRPAFHIDQLDFALDAEWTVITDRDFCWGHWYSCNELNDRKNEST